MNLILLIINNPAVFTKRSMGFTIGGILKQRRKTNRRRQAPAGIIPAPD
jgi:hypothetical protein